MRFSPADFQARCPRCHLLTRVREVDGVWRLVPHGCQTDDLDAGPLVHAWATASLDRTRWYAAHADAHVAFLEKALHDARNEVQKTAHHALHEAEDLAALVEDTVPRPPKEPPP